MGLVHISPVRIEMGDNYKGYFNGIFFVVCVAASLLQSRLYT